MRYNLCLVLVPSLFCSALSLYPACFALSCPCTQPVLLCLVLVPSLFCSALSLYPACFALSFPCTQPVLLCLVLVPSLFCSALSCPSLVCLVLVPSLFCSALSLYPACFALSCLCTQPVLLCLVFVPSLLNSIMVSCAAWGCTDRSEKGVRMYGFPAERERRETWLTQVSRSNLTSQEPVVTESYVR